jgi:hypothetical protein
MTKVEQIGRRGLAVARLFEIRDPLAKMIVTLDAVENIANQCLVASAASPLTGAHRSHQASSLGYDLGAPPRLGQSIIDIRCHKAPTGVSDEGCLALRLQAAEPVADGRRGDTQFPRCSRQRSATHPRFQHTNAGHRRCLAQRTLFLLRQLLAV